jgi:hypothetical protein
MRIKPLKLNRESSYNRTIDGLDPKVGNAAQQVFGQVSLQLQETIQSFVKDSSGYQFVFNQSDATYAISEGKNGKRMVVHWF